ncbi:hypothetical protein [Massilia suwonensis]|uniref:EF-hand domain-containing protein n=1 Tax=Massilia suwonensis TaxID=648895 RepID=A0ABW0MR99_9BURK
MVSSIGSNNLAQSLPARVESRTAQATAPGAVAAASITPADDGDTGTASMPSAQSAATARVGGQLDAQFDAARVQRAQEEMALPEGVPPGPPPGEEAASDEVQGTDSAAADTVAAAAAKPAGGAPAGGASGSSAEESTDYIAAADTNNDRKVSEEERIAYEKKQASEAQGTTAQARAQEVQQAYLPQDSAGSQLDIEA